MPDYLCERRVYNMGMTLQVIVHKDKDGGFWAEVPALPGCATQGETMEELMANVREAVNGWLEVSR
jgi:predicted RNase H-like HicB family nuclease